MKKNIQNLMFALIAIGFLWSCGNQSGQTENANDSTKTAKIDAPSTVYLYKAFDFKEKINTCKVKHFKHKVIDVRTKEEFGNYHLFEAINYDINDEANFKAAVDSVDKRVVMFVYCKSGNRSSKAAQVLKDLGFISIYNLEGGIEAWEKEKYPLAYPY